MAHEYMSGVRILVPLDGSQLAERALPLAERLALALHSTLVLARITREAAVPVMPLEAQIPLEVYQRVADDEAHRAEVYLTDVAARVRQQEVWVETITRRGDAASILLDLLAVHQLGLVIMTTHGRTGMARFTLGSVADRLVRASHVPVLLLRPADASCRYDQLDRALVPLDGSEHAETALEVARALAGPVIRQLTLLRIVPYEDTHEQRREMEEMEEADRYLDRVQARLVRELADRAAIHTQILEGDPAVRIIQSASDECDLVIMATHGASGTQRWIFGSVTDRVLHDSTTPLLLVCPSESSVPTGGYQRVGTASQSSR